MIPSNSKAVTSDQHSQINSNQTYQQDERPDKQEEACGVFGVYAPQEDVATLSYF